MSYIIGIDIGGTKTAVSLGTSQGKVITRAVFATKGVKYTLGHASTLIRHYIAHYGTKGKDILGIGISCAGPLDLKKGILISAPNMRTWRNVALKETFSRRFKLPVVVENDANAAALAEKTFGAGKKVKNLFYYTVSTGVGGGLIINGKIHHGASGDAGEIGHTLILPGGPKCGCGKKGCLEALASGTAIAREARARAPKNSVLLTLAGERKNITAVHVARAARSGDAFSKKIYQEAAFYMGLSVVNVIQVFNPEMIVIGGGVSKTGKLFFAPLMKTVRSFAWKRPLGSCKIVSAQLKDNVGDLGAMSGVLQRLG